MSHYRQRETERKRRSLQPLDANRYSSWPLREYNLLPLLPNGFNYVSVEASHLFLIIGCLLLVRLQTIPPFWWRILHAEKMRTVLQLNRTSKILGCDVNAFPSSAYTATIDETDAYLQLKACCICVAFQNRNGQIKLWCEHRHTCTLRRRRHTYVTASDWDAVHPFILVLLPAQHPRHACLFPSCSFLSYIYPHSS